MLLDVSKIEEMNQAHIDASEFAKVNLIFTTLCIDTLKKSASIPSLVSPDEITYLRLAVRVINAAGACGHCALGGYYQPAMAQIRDIIEVGFLLDLFGRDPSQLTNWHTMSDKDRKNAFKVVNVRKKLDELDGFTEQQRKIAYDVFSQHGTHAGPAAVQFISPNNNTIIGPFPDKQVLIALTYDLAKFTSAATMYAVKFITAKKISGKLGEEIARHNLEFAHSALKWKQESVQLAQPVGPLS